jgi:uncharacterized membrane protein YdbT with pleckstrin-like domain
LSAAQPPNTNPAPVEDHRPHAPPDDSETTYFDGRPLFGGKPGEVILLTVLAILFIVSPLVIRIGMGEHQWPQRWVIIVLEVIGVSLLVAPAIVTKQVRYRISNYRIDYERGFLAKDIKSLELWHVEDMSFHQSIIDRLIGIGTIRVISHDDTMPDLRMRGIPNARKIFEELKQRVIAVKRQTGVLKVDTGT